MDLVKTKIKSELRNGLTYVRQESYAILGRDMRCITVLQTKDTTHHFMNEEKYYRYNTAAIDYRPHAVRLEARMLARAKYWS